MRVPVSLRGAEAVVVAFLLILSAGGLVSAQAAASDSPTVRKAAVAGMFYPAAADDLRRVVETSLSEAKKEEFPGTIRAILAPHAGYVFCSRGLGAAYKQIEGPAFKYDTVILIGPSHRFATKASALSSVHVWETPLGPVQVASDLCREFARSTDRIEFDDRAHANEHCLEVQLPYLLTAAKGKPFKIVPMLISSSDLLDHQRAANALIALAAKGSTLIVVSTDLSHYPDASTAEKVDQAILEAVKSLNPTRLMEENRKLMQTGYKGLGCTMCGLDAALTLVRAAAGLGISKAAVVSYTHSGMVSGDNARVVGYGAMVFTGTGTGASGTQQEALVFSRESKRELIRMARDAAAAAVKGDWVDFHPSDNPELQMQAGCFVTLKRKGELRGCIGRFSSDQPLWKTVREMAIASATRDARFSANPVRSDEVPDLDVEISVLSPMRRVSDPLQEIKLGTHGIVIQGSGRSGTFLPQVATETGWTLEQFLGHCSRDKAMLGWEGWKSPAAQVYTYTATIVREED